MPVGQNQLSGTQLVTTGLIHVDKWIYWHLAKWNLGRFIFWVKTKLTGRKSLIITQELFVQLAKYWKLSPLGPLAHSRELSAVIVRFGVKICRGSVWYWCADGSYVWDCRCTFVSGPFSSPWVSLHEIPSDSTNGISSMHSGYGLRSFLHIILFISQVSKKQSHGECCGIKGFIEIGPSSHMRGAGEVQVLVEWGVSEGYRKFHLEAIRKGPWKEAHEKDLKANASVSVSFLPLPSVARCLVVGWGHCWLAGPLLRRQGRESRRRQGQAGAH